MSDAWFRGLRQATSPEVGVAVAEPDLDVRTRVPWRRIETETGHIDVQALESGRLGRRLLLVEFDADDVETERRIMRAIKSGD